MAEKTWRSVSRRQALASIVAGASGAGCVRWGGALSERVDVALARGLRALIAAQSHDGSWRSQTYGALKDGMSLTGPVLKAIVFGPTVDGSQTARRLGLDYLIRHVGKDGSVDYGPYGSVYPVYTAATAVLVLSRFDCAEGRLARDAWLRDLRKRQLVETLGWEPGDLAYGAWGASGVPSCKSADARLMGLSADADLSSTLFALGALRFSGVSDRDPAVKAARMFVERCQNLPTELGSQHSVYDDGGFFFTPTDPVRNKAGVAGNDLDGRERYHSYGGSTADGIRALLRCGLPVNHPRILAARSWLEHHFRADHNAGTFEAIREAERDATYYYFTWSMAHAFRALGCTSWLRGVKRVNWAEELASALLAKQDADGFWSNPWLASKEDDPLIATPLALGALGLCRMIGALPS